MFAYIKPSRKRDILIYRYRGGGDQCCSFFKLLIRTFIACTSRSLCLFSTPLILMVKQREWISQQEDWRAPAAFAPFGSVAGASLLTQPLTQEEQKVQLSPPISHISLLLFHCPGAIRDLNERWPVHVMPRPLDWV